MMKKIQSAVYGAAAVLTAILPKLFVCPQGGGTDAMRCWQTAEAEGIIALGFLLVGAVLAFSKSERVKAGADLAGIAASVCGVLIPLKWIGGCMNPMMPCHTLGFPVIYGICTITFLTAVIGLMNRLLKSVKPSPLSACEN